MSEQFDFLKDVQRPKVAEIRDAPRDPVPSAAHVDPLPVEVPRVRPPAKSAKGSGYQRTTVYLSLALYQRVKQKAFQEGRELSEVVEFLLDTWAK
jgi:hypothetical protein